MIVPPDNARIGRRGKLAAQVSVIRWIVPPALALFVFMFEFAEHVDEFDHVWSDLDFALELFVFGVLGPVLIAITLTWLVRNLRELERTTQSIHGLNAQLERKVALRTEELAHANAELRELDHLKSEFVALVSHELRAPLTNIQGGLELVLSSQDVCPPVQDNLRIIQVEVRRLARMVQRILDVSVMESGQVSLKLGPIALRPLLREAVRHAGLNNSMYRVVLDIPDQVQLAVADEERVTDILASLLQNAIKYSPDGGEIRISLRFDSDFAYVSIQDHGIGIPAEDLHHLTEKFYRGRLTNHSDGYGLGLYFVNELVKAQGGCLQIASAGSAGHGSTFTFSLPLERESLYEQDPAY